jgi:hypothetical protein
MRAALSRFFLAATAIVMVVSPAVAAERMTVCLEYADTERVYKVEGTCLMGSELNSATHSLNYDSLSRDFVVFWSQGLATVIELQSAFSCNFTFPIDGADQDGRTWRVHNSSDISCPL